MDLREVGVVVANVDRLPVGRERDDPIAPAATVDDDQEFRKLPEADDLRVAELVDAVDVDGDERVILVHREVLRPAVDLPRAREDDPDLRVLVPARLEDRELAPAVDLEIRVRIRHRVEVARLSCEVEEEVLAL